MVSSNVRMLFVTNHYHEVMGLLTINDLNGPEPIQAVSENVGKMEELMVRDTMTPRLNLAALEFSDIQKARVDDLLETLKQHGTAARPGGGNRSGKRQADHPRRLIHHPAEQAAGAGDAKLPHGWKSGRTGEQRLNTAPENGTWPAFPPVAITLTIRSIDKSTQRTHSR